VKVAANAAIATKTKIRAANRIGLDCLILPSHGAAMGIVMWCLGSIVEVSSDRQTQSEDRVFPPDDSLLIL
jgi:hypothetical protein